MNPTRLLLVITLLAPTLFAGTRKLTIAEIFDPKKAAAIVAPSQSGFVWIDDAHFFWPRRNAEGETVAAVLVEAATGKEIALFDIEDLQAQVLKIEGVTEEDAKRIARPREPRFNPKKDAFLVTIRENLYVYTISRKQLTRLTSVEGEEKEASFSPDGASVAFIRAGDLYTIPATGGTERRITTGGSAELLNGILDWVYQEEIYGRGIFKGYWWSPDSRSLAWLQLDEKPVPEFAVVDHIPYRQKVENTDYPKAGDPNPNVKLFVTNLSSGTTTEVSQKGYTDVGLLVVEVGWTKDSRRLVAQFQDREQTWLDLLYADPSTGETSRILREKTEAWVERAPSPEWLADGSFLWLSERDGYSHIYRVSADGTQQTQLTRGPWEVRTLHGLDRTEKVVYFSGTEDSSIEQHLYRMRVDGTRRERLTASGRSHTVSFNPRKSYFIDTSSSLDSPPRVQLHDEGGKLVRVVHQPANTLAEYAISTPELLKVPTRDGFVMEAILIKPLDFDAAAKYPVYQHTYGGPHAPQVRNAWGGATYLFHQLLAQHGIAVWICDNRTASGKGAVSAWPAYKRLGEMELRDIEDGLAWLKKQYAWVDGSRVMINGWSYGGFMVSYALTHSKSFKAGIAGGTVVDWRDYDSIYTERYMLTPEHNKDGYENTAPRKKAANLSGNLLLVHGTLDDNVHVQNTVQFAYDLQKAGKQFELMLYPKSRHGVTDRQLVLHMRQMMFDFVLRNLAENGDARQRMSAGQ